MTVTPDLVQRAMDSMKQTEAMPEALVQMQVAIQEIKVLAQTMTDTLRRLSSYEDVQMKLLAALTGKSEEEVQALHQSLTAESLKE